MTWTAINILQQTSSQCPIEAKRATDIMSERSTRPTKSKTVFELELAKIDKKLIIYEQHQDNILSM